MTVSGVPPAAVDAVVGEVRAFLRVEGEEEEALLKRLAASAILLGEAFIGDLLVMRTVEDVLPTDVGGWQLLAAGPVSAIVAVTGLLAPGVPLALASDAYAVDVDREGRGWVRVIAPGAATRVTVSYSAGLAADWTAVPAPIVQGVVALAAHLFNDRDGAQPPAAVAALWRPYRRMRLAAEARR